jgi:cytochrome c-type biogenesis protein CcmE
MSDENDEIDEHAETLPWQPGMVQPPLLDPDKGGAADLAPEPAAKARGGRIWIAALLLIAAGGLLWLVVGGVEQNLVYYLTPSELIAKGEEGIGANVRLGGMVQKGTINWQPESTTLSFTVGDRDATIAVKANAIPPEMFREGIGVIVEGRLQADGTFTTNRLMVRHSNEYKAPGDGETVDLDYMSQTLEDDPS